VIPEVTGGRDERFRALVSFGARWVPRAGARNFVWVGQLNLLPIFLAVAS